MDIPLPCPKQYADRIEPSETGCWLWQGGADSRSYGMVRRDGKSYYLHRLMYEWFKGPISEGQVIRHTCDTPRCVNPAHLLTGTKGDNIRDAFERGQLSAIVPEDVVRSWLDGHTTTKHIVITYGITVKHLYRIKKGYKRPCISHLQGHVPQE